MKNHEMLIKYLREKRGLIIQCWFYGYGYHFPNKCALLLDVEYPTPRLTFSHRYFTEKMIKHLAKVYFNVHAEEIAIFWKEKKPQY